MIYTVTLNPAIDKTVVIENLQTGAVNRVASVREDAGGKGVNVSKCLKNLGAESVAAMILAGGTGDRLEKMLQELGISVLPVRTEGQNRTNLKIIDPVKKENTDINEPGPAVSEALLEQFRQTLGAKIRPGDIVILSGSLPAGVDRGLYGLWTAYFRSLGACVYLDADGEPMEKGMAAVPYMIKPNNEELAALLGKPSLTLEEMLAEGRRLLEAGIREIVISLGGDGALFVSEDGCFHAEGLQVPVKSTVGAGDSVVAATAYGQVKNLSREERIRLSVAMGAASVMQSGTQSPESALVWELAKQVKLRKL
ncbi:MAG: 1-phosphofructokinase [Oscillospiraceae bacterium]|nr:1-phosphofructokinase [Oscillospiraceae bacterium]